MAGFVVAAAADSAYAWPAALSLLSAATNSTAPCICLFVADAVPAAVEEAIQHAFSKRGVPLEYVRADLGPYNHLPTGLHLTRAAYCRLLIPDLAESLAGLTLYVDADTLAIGDVAPLTTALRPNDIVGAVRDRLIPVVGEASAIPDWRQHGLSPSSPFFNSGVLLINNTRWRESNVSDRVVARLSEAPEAARLADQGALNLVLYGQWRELPQDWNRAVRRSAAARVGSLVVSRRSVFSLRRTRILHFFQRVKPWTPEYPPGYLNDLYRAKWHQLLPIEPPPKQTYGDWLRRHAVSRR